MNDIVLVWQNISGSGMLLALYVVAVLFLLYEEKEPYKKVLFVYFPGLWCGILFLPITYQMISSFIDAELYYRFFWMLPIMPTLAYAAVSVLDKVRDLDLKLQKVVFGSLLGIIIISGDFVYNNWRFSIAENIYHVPQEIVDVCERIEIEGREVLAAFPLDQMQYVRQYNATICMPYGRDTLVGEWNIYHPIYDEMNKEVLDAKALAEALTNGACVYVVLYEDTPIVGDLESYGYTFKEEIASMNIYENLKMLDATY